jgi:hypothetical protein
MVTDCVSAYGSTGFGNPEIVRLPYAPAGRRGVLGEESS